LHSIGALDGYTKRIIVSDGGPGHFKVYKTQNWMSKWDQELRRKGITTEWNMYFPNLGHNVCDSHAGKMKVYVLIYLGCSFSRTVREAEGNFHAMVTANDVVEAIQGKLSRTMTTIFDAREIDGCDEENVKSVGKGFIRNYQHFSYRGAGVVACRYIKDVGPYVLHKMNQGSGTD